MINKLIFGACLLTGLLSCQNNSGESVQEIRDSGGPNSEMIKNPVSADLPTDTTQLARIKYAEEEFNFGTAIEGEVIKHTFKFTNVGKVPLTILSARSSCGCTIPKWPEEPIAPGATGEILVNFNTDMKVGNQRKTVYVTANTYPNESKVALIGLVNPK